ncbi:MAG TPA: sugar transferase [Acidobacteriota bacterium]|nr:sugar transferase [Acidobacteriota bacterium]
MLREHYTLFRRLHIVCDLAVAAAVYALARGWVAGVSATAALREPGLLVLLGVLAIALAAGTAPYEYRFRSLYSAGTVIACRWGMVMAAVLAVFFWRADWALDRTSMAIIAVIVPAALIAVRIIVASVLRAWRRTGRSYKNALIIGTGPTARKMVDTILTRPERGLRVIGFLDNRRTGELWRYRDIPVRGSFAELPHLVRTEQVDYVLFCVNERGLARVRGMIHLCTRMGVPAVVITDWFAHFTARRRSCDFLGHPGLLLDSAPRHSAAVYIKNVMDRVLALAGLVLTTPIMAAAAVAVRLTSRGPVFFSQVRLGRNGRRFHMWKFRTMIKDAERLRASLENHNELSGPAFKIADDPRITRVGRFLRRTSIDELPQLFNVLRGDMSLVGPRPPLPDEVRHYDERQRRRLAVKPGLTCLWQIGGRSNVDFDEWMRLDLEYIDNWSIRKDAEILVKTVPAVLKGAGAK